MIRNEPKFLRTVLLVDAALAAVAGLATAAAAGLLEPLLGIPAMLLASAGAILLAYAAVAAFVARRPSIPRPAVLALIAVNLVWGAECLLLPGLGWIDPTGLGWAFLIAQAVFVIVVADLQWLGIRRAPRTAAA